MDDSGLPHPASLSTHHGLPRFAFPGLLELRHVLYHAIHPEFAGRMWIHIDRIARVFWTAFFAPYAAESQEVALFRSVAVDFLTSGDGRTVDHGFLHGH